MTVTTTHTAGSLEVPGARLHYEVRGSGPVVVLAGAPMDASAFEPLAELLALDHTVVTTDPRGVHRSRVVDPDADSTPELRAADLSRLLTHLGAGRVAVLGSSGGAVTALSLAQLHPEQVHTVIAHEPPLQELLEDRRQRRDATEGIIAAYVAEGAGAAWARFMTAAGLPAPGPTGGGEPQAGPPPGDDPVQVATERHFFLHELRGTVTWRPDLELLRHVPTRVVVGVGETSGGQLCDLTSGALAAGLGVDPVRFPGGHIGFVEDPAAFAGGLREVLARSLDHAFTAPVEKDGAFATYVTVPGSVELLGTRRPVKVAGLVEGERFTATLMPSGEGPHWLPLPAALVRAVGRSHAGEEVAVHLLERRS